MTFHNFIYSFKKENLIPLNITLVYSGKKSALLDLKLYIMYVILVLK